jgi:uncharacterized protein GlcG (DUF336 family)
MTDGLIRSFMLARQDSYTPPGEFIMTRGTLGCVLFAAVVATLSVAAAARGADRERSTDVATTATVTGACAGLPGHDALRSALVQARGVDNGGFNLDMWGAVVNRDGIVCAVAFTGSDRGRQWPGSRVIAAQKANTANAFSLPGLSLSTANLWAAVQPGGSLYGLQHSNPVDTGLAYQGPASEFGQDDDPMVGQRIGGVNVFGGGLALYAAAKRAVGGLGVSGDTSCADHNIAWRVRNILQLDHLLGVGGVSGDKAHPDNIVFDISGGTSKGGFGHPQCLNTGDAAMLPPVKE